MMDGRQPKRHMQSQMEENKVNWKKLISLTVLGMAMLRVLQIIRALQLVASKNLKKRVFSVVCIKRVLVARKRNMKIRTTVHVCEFCFSKGKSNPHSGKDSLKAKMNRAMQYCSAEK